MAAHIRRVSPGADFRMMLQRRRFDESGKLGTWNLRFCKISRLPRSFGALVCNGPNYRGTSLDLSDNKFESLPESFSEIIVAGSLSLSGNPQLTGVPENFPNVKGRVFRNGD